jgi:hypothetical protein
MRPIVLVWARESAVELAVRLETKRKVPGF